MAERERRGGSLAADLGALLESADAADMTLVVGSAQLPAHSQVLTARSPVFAAMFRADMREGRSCRVEIANMEEAVLRQVLSFIYTDTSPELGKMAAELLSAADKYDLPQLKEMCEQQMARDLSVENAASTAAAAELYRCPGLRRASVQFIASHPEVLATGGWARLQQGDAALAVEVCRQLAEELPRPPPAKLPRPPPAEALGSRVLTQKQKQILSERLLSAASMGDKSLVSDLLQLGAPVGATDEEGNTALHRAVINGHEDTVKCLIDAGADVNSRCSNGQTPLHQATCKDGQQNIIWMLVGASAHVDIQDNEGQTPLHLAARYEKVCAEKAVLLAGARRDLKDNSGKTAADLATINKSVVSNHIGFNFRIN